MVSLAERLIVLTLLLLYYISICSLQQCDIVIRDTEQDRFSLSVFPNMSNRISDYNGIYGQCPNTSIFIYNKTTNQSAQCMDIGEFVIKDQKPFQIKNNKNECLGVGNNEKHEYIACDGPNTLSSTKWILVDTDHIINVDKAKCLENQKSKLEPCKLQGNNQKWSCKSQKNQCESLAEKGKKENIVFQNYRASLKQANKQGMRYRFTNGQFMYVISPININSVININAPIFVGQDSCSVHRNKPQSTEDGINWESLAKWNVDFALIKKTPSVSTSEIQLQLNNSKLLQQLSGRIVRLKIKCSGMRLKNEGGYIFLKIPTQNPDYTCVTSLSPTTKDISRTTIVTDASEKSSSESISTFTSAPKHQESVTTRQPYAPSSDVSRSSKSSTIIIVIVIVIVCSIIVAVVCIVWYRKRREKPQESAFNMESNQQTREENYDTESFYHAPTIRDSHYEAAAAVDSTQYYSYPSHKPTTDAKNKQEFQYDYATREETALFDDIGKNGSNNQEIDGKAGYHTLEEPNTVKKNSKLKEEPKENEQPMYHTLEEPNTVEKNGKLEEPKVNEQPMYHTLEEPNTVEKVGKLEEEPKVNEQPMYHTLEEPNTVEKVGKLEEEPKVNGQPMYHTLEEQMTK